MEDEGDKSRNREILIGEHKIRERDKREGVSDGVQLSILDTQQNSECKHKMQTDVEKLPNSAAISM